MSCRQVIDAIATRGDLESLQVQEHAATCDECSSRLEITQLLSSSEAIEESTVPWIEFKESLGAQNSVLVKIRNLSSKARLAVLSVVALGLSLSQIFKMRPDFHDFPQVRMVLTLGLLAVVLLLAWRVILRPLYRAPLSSNGVKVFGSVLLIVPVLIALLPEAHTGHAASLEGMGDDFGRRALACFLYGAVFGLIVWSAAIAASRTGLRLATPVVLSGAAAALVGNIILQIHCPLTGGLHLLVGHGSIGIFLFAGAMIWALLKETRSSR